MGFWRKLSAASASAIAHTTQAGNAILDVPKIALEESGVKAQALADRLANPSQSDDPSLAAMVKLHLKQKLIKKLSE